MKKLPGWFMPIGTLVSGLLLSFLLAQVLHQSAARDWELRAEQEANRRSLGLLGWMEENFSTLSALVALVENSGNVDIDEFLNAVDGLESRSKANFVPAKALLALGKNGWVVKYSSAPANADATTPLPDAPLPKGLLPVLALAESTPGEWFISPPFSGTGSTQFAYVVIVPSSRSELAVVGVLGLQRMAETLLASDTSAGLGLTLNLKPQGLAQKGSFRIGKSEDVVMHRSVNLTQTAHADLELVWEFAPNFAGGVDRRLALYAGGGSAVVSLLLALFVANVQREKRRITQKISDGYR